MHDVYTMIQQDGKGEVENRVNNFWDKYNWSNAKHALELVYNIDDLM